MKQSFVIALLLQCAVASHHMYKAVYVDREDMFVYVAEEPAAEKKEEPAKAELPPVEDKVPDANVEDVDDQVNKQIKEKLEQHDKREKQAITDENKEEEQNAIVSTFKKADNWDSQKFDEQHDAWFKRDMAARQAKINAKIKKEGGHVKTELDDKKEEELNDEEKAQKSAEKAEEGKAKEKADKEAEQEKAKKPEKDGETWTAEMPQKFLMHTPAPKKGLYE